MPYKRKKDVNKLVAKWKLKSKYPHYWHVFLWEDRESFEANSRESKGALGVHNPCTFTVDGKGNYHFPPKMGEIHFIKDKWNLEIVVHELMHAFLFRISALSDVNGLFNQVGDLDEKHCLEFGQWVENIYTALWEVNPVKGWKKVK